MRCPVGVSSCTRPSSVWGPFGTTRFSFAVQRRVGRAGVRLETYDSVGYGTVGCARKTRTSLDATPCRVPTPPLAPSASEPLRGDLEQQVGGLGLTDAHPHTVALERADEHPGPPGALRERRRVVAQCQP